MGGNGKLALYLRISQEDGGEGESGSISNQRDLLYGYLRAHPELARMEPVELVDDGFSGTSFDRPAMGRLLKLARQGEIGCVLVKDFSRFGRNYIEAGDFLERIFPLLGVRFISVNDRFDSARQKAGGGMDVALSNLVYDLYSKDLSQKVKSARRVKMLRGEFTSPFAFFGYRKDPEERNRLLADPRAAEVVRRIFALAGAGARPGEIARRLNDEAVPTPLAYKRAGGNGRRWGESHEDNFWTKDAVTRILRDERYTGKLICGKWERQLGKQGASRIPRSDWVVVENSHEAIVSKEEFALAQRCMAGYRERPKPKPDSGLPRGAVKCGCCGYALRRGAGEYRCATGKAKDSQVCDSTRVSEAALKNALAAILQKLSQLNLEPDRLREDARQKQRERLRGQAAALKRLEHAIEQLNNGAAGLYEAYRLGKLTQEQYLQRKQQDGAHLEEYEGRQKLCRQAIARIKAGGEIPQPWEQVGELAPRLAQMLTGAITVYPHGRLELTLKCTDFICDTP